MLPFTPHFAYRSTLQYCSVKQVVRFKKSTRTNSKIWLKKVFLPSMFNVL